MIDDNKIQELIKGGAFLVDVRTPEEYIHGSVEGALNIPLDTIPDHVSDFEGKENILLFCQSGGRCGQAKMYLEREGIENIYNGGSWIDVEYLRSQIDTE